MVAVKYICFDMDGVIIDSEPAHYEAFRLTLKYSADKILNEKEYAAYFAGKTDRQGFTDYFSVNDFAHPPIDLLLRHKSQIYSDVVTSKTLPYPDTIAFIHTIPKEWRCALVTSSSRHEANFALERFDIAAYFNVIVTADDIRNSKPYPDGYIRAANLLHAPPSKCIAIEDSPSGIRAALSAGMKCIALTTTHDEIDLQEATTVVSRLDPQLF